MMKPQLHVFHVGDRVRLQFGPQGVTGRIIEDRGVISSGGRRMFRVEVLFDRTNTMFMEVPEDQLKPA